MPSSRSRTLLLLPACLLVLLAAYGPARADTAASPEPLDWAAEFGVEPGFALEVDTSGHRLPSALAFVPHPGPAPDDPLYFLTELRGTVKVVTNDRTVRTFASGFASLEPEAELPDGRGQGGVAGLCLDPGRGYVFVTFAYEPERGVLRNGIVRFETRPGRFSTVPTATRSLGEMFASQPSGLAHQVGGCAVEQDHLYVGVGDAWRSYAARQPGVLVGKVLRLTLEGLPAPGHPFRSESVPAARYVFALGLRNPFGLLATGGRLFVFDNGVHVDRFLEVRERGDYLWDGHDWSIGTRAGLVLAPSVGPTALARASARPRRWPAPHAGRFFVGTYGPDPRPGILAFGYDADEGRVTARPRYFLQHRPRAVPFAPIVALAFGPEGLYFAPMLGRGEEPTPVMRIVYAPDRPHPIGVGANDDPLALMTEKGCLGCHKVSRDRASVGRSAPPLDDPAALVARVEALLDSADYLSSLVALDHLDHEPQRSYAAARRAVLAARGRERVERWLTYRIMEPRFDRLVSAMPALGLTEAEARVIAAHLVREAPAAGRLRGLAARLLPWPIRPRHLAASFLAGAAAGVGGLAVGLAARRRVRRRPG